MEIRINVMLDVTPRLETLAQTALTALLDARDGKDVELAGDGQKREETAPEAVPGQICAVIPPPAVTRINTQPASGPAPSEVPESPQPAAPETFSGPAASEPEPGIPDDETMRTMMDIAISKVCGTNDWKESQDSRVIALRRSCTGCFKEISRHLGAEKPTALQGEKRDRFLSELDNIFVDAGQCKAVWQAF